MDIPAKSFRRDRLEGVMAKKKVAKRKGWVQLGTPWIQRSRKKTTKSKPGAKKKTAKKR
jgi:hypothetical protein